MNGEEALIEFHVDLIKYNVKLLKSMVKPPELWEATIKAYPDLLTNVINVSDFHTHQPNEYQHPSVTYPLIEAETQRITDACIDG